MAAMFRPSLVLYMLRVCVRAFVFVCYLSLTLFYDVISLLCPSTCCSLGDVMSTLRQMEEAMMRSGAQIEELRAALQETVHERTEAELMAARWRAELDVARAQRTHDAETARHQADELAHLRQEVAQAQVAQVERVKTLEIELAAANGESQQHRRAAHTAKRQVAQLQAMLTEAEGRHRTESSQLVPLHGSEVQARLDQERQRLENIQTKVQEQMEGELAKAER